MNGFELKIVPEKEMIAIALEAAKAYSSRFLSGSKEVSRLALALEEAIANVPNYSLTDSVKDITIRAEAQDGELKISVLDQGLPGNYETTLKDEDALGLTIMRRSVDQVNVLNLGLAGRCQELIQYYSERPVFAREVSAAAPEHIDLPAFEIMPLRREDALMVCRGIYNEYGFSYSDDLAFYPDRFYAATRKGQLYSVVAVTPEGKAVGHLAAWEWDEIPGVWECGMAVTEPAYRGNGIFEKLLAHVTEYVKRQPTARLHLATAVTEHDLSQRGAYRRGLHAIGFVFNLNGASLYASSFKENADDPIGRDSYIYMAEIFDHSKKTVYAVPEIKTILEERYADIHAPREIITADLPPETAVTESKHQFISSWQYGRLCVFTIGRDIADCLKREVLNAKRNGEVSMELCLSMDQPGISTAYQAAVELGFFFNGILPQTLNGDILLMGKILSQSIHYDIIHVNEESKAFLAQIRALDPDQQEL